MSMQMPTKKAEDDTDQADSENLAQTEARSHAADNQRACEVTGGIGRHRAAGLCERPPEIGTNSRDKQRIPESRETLRGGWTKGESKSGKIPGRGGLRRRHHIHCLPIRLPAANR